MKKHSRAIRAANKAAITVGIDIGDKFSRYCVLNEQAEVVEEGRIKTEMGAVERHFAGEPGVRIAMECGTHSPWMSRLLKELGHEVIVANARKVESITSNESKCDRYDAEQLARLAHYDPKLLHGVRHRGVERQQDLMLIQTRATLVRARTMIINTARSLVKSAGKRLPKCDSSCFPSKVQEWVPAEVRPALVPLIEQTARLNEQIARLDQQVEALAKKYPEIRRLRTAPGVGPLVAATYVLTLDRTDAAGHSRSAGAFLGLRPRRDQSGDYDRQCRITKTGNTYLRSQLIQSAHYILGRFGPDSALRRWGLKLAASGGKRGKKRAIVAVARKLAVILHCMWRTEQSYRAFPEARVQLSAARGQA
jgi:transposase